MKNRIKSFLCLLCALVLFTACSTCKYGCPAKITNIEINKPLALPAMTHISSEVAD